MKIMFTHFLVCWFFSWSCSIISNPLNLKMESRGVADTIHTQPCLRSNSTCYRLDLQCQRMNMYLARRQNNSRIYCHCVPIVADPQLNSPNGKNIRWKSAHLSIELESDICEARIIAYLNHSSPWGVIWAEAFGAQN